MSKILPTVGRVVLFTPAQSDDIVTPSGGKCASIVTHVWRDSMVNLCVMDANGNTHSRTSVLLVQDGEPQPAGFFCEWMPYQKGQAAKTEALEKALDANPASESACMSRREADLEDLLRSAHAIAERRGKDTAWARFAARIKSAGVGSVTAKTFRLVDGDDPETD